MNWTLSYDSHGNVTGKGPGNDSYVFDAADRLQAVAGKESYRYDGHGRRVKVTRLSDGKSAYPIYTLTGQLLSEDDARANTRTDYVSLNGSLVGKRVATLGRQNWKLTYEHTDALHSPTVETDASGSMTRAEHYTPYGEPGDGRYVQGPGFTGHVTDAATGLTYAQQRYYDPVLGRFLSPDPVQADGKGGGFNRYWYANNNPYRFADPDGRDVVYSVDPNAAGGNGHTTLYFQDGKENWYSYNQGAVGDGGTSGNLKFLSGRDQRAAVAIQRVDPKSIPEGGFRINTSRKQDVKIALSAAESMDAHNSGKKRYNLYSNNCTDAAVDVVNNSGAGITVSNPATTVRPNSWIKEVKGDKDAVRRDPPSPSPPIPKDGKS